MHLAIWDWLIIGLYAAGVIAIGLRARRRAHSSESYFLAGRSLRWSFIGASLYAANISTEHFVGLAGTAYAIGMVIGSYERIKARRSIPPSGPA